MFAVFLAMACSSEPMNVPAPVKPEEAVSQRGGELADRLGMSRLNRAELLPVLGEALDYEHHQVWPLSLQVFEDFRISGALYVPKSKGPHPGFLMAHGHFGEGKSSGEAQAPAHALAHQGHLVLALDTPGVEEGDAPSRQIHHEAGQENRLLLEKEGTSAMALQLHGLQAGLDYLQSRGDVSWLSAGGASGGAVQAFYLSQIDPRIQAVVLASFVPMPRVNREGGCPCDWVPGGWPHDLIAQHTLPSLWMSEGAEARPVGLPENGHFVTHAGPHGFEQPMITEMTEWLQSIIPDFQSLREPLQRIPHSPSTALASSSVGKAGIGEILQSRAPQ